MRTLQSEFRRLHLLQPETDKKIRQLQKNCQSERKTKSERLSTHDIEDLMGIRRPRYKRHKGAIKQK